MQATDDDLIRGVADGREEAFVALYRRHQRTVHRFALHMTGNPTIAEEATQETFLSLMRNPGGFDPARGVFSAFLIGVARNHVRRLMSRDREFASIDDDSSYSPEVAAEGQDVLADLTREQTIQAVRQAVQVLPAGYREVVVLCDLQEFSYEQTAEILGCAIGTVRSRLHRARAMLFERIESKHARQPARGMRCVV
jgi:RNA polymerase sigma-70 factor (ECF subfamily)